MDLCKWTKSGVNKGGSDDQMTVVQTRMGKCLKGKTKGERGGEVEGGGAHRVREGKHTTEIKNCKGLETERENERERARERKKERD